jgi:hypothetical protein
MWFVRLRPFAVWLDDRGVQQLSAVGDPLLNAYLEHVRALSVIPHVKYQLLNAVRALWAYSAHLPADCRLATREPWQGKPITELAAVPPRGRFNATPRIAADTMQALLHWALVLVEDLGPDISSAWREFRQLSEGRHPGQDAYRGLPTKDRVRQFVQQAARTGAHLPEILAGPARSAATIWGACWRSSPNAGAPRSEPPPRCTPGSSACRSPMTATSA